MSANKLKKEVADFQWVEDCLTALGKHTAAVVVTLILAIMGLLRYVWTYFYPEPPKRTDES